MGSYGPPSDNDPLLHVLITTTISVHHSRCSPPSAPYIRFPSLAAPSVLSPSPPPLPVFLALYSPSPPPLTPASLHPSSALLSSTPSLLLTLSFCPPLVLSPSPDLPSAISSVAVVCVVHCCSFPCPFLPAHAQHSKQSKSVVAPCMNHNTLKDGDIRAKINHGN